MGDMLSEFRFPEIIGDKILATELPELKDGEKSESEQITFYLHVSQKELIEKALLLADSEHELNKNKNGNRLFYIVKEWADGRG